MAEYKLPLLVKISFKKCLEERKFSASKKGDELRLTKLPLIGEDEVVKSITEAGADESRPFAHSKC